jgi:hypothetical protein
MLDESREILFTKGSFCGAAKHGCQTFPKFYKILPIVALPQPEASGSSAGIEGGWARRIIRRPGLGEDRRARAPAQNR